MKILLYNKKQKMYDKSGVGRAMKHQIRALDKVGVEYTTNEADDYDILHLNTIDLSSYFMARKAKRKGKKIIFHAHSTKEDFRNSFFLSNQIAPLFKIHLKNMYKLGDYILTPTEYSKSLLETYKLNRQIEAISNGVDLERFSYNQDKVDKFKEYFNINENEKVVISVGLYFERKGLPDFIEIARKFPEYKFIWFGYTKLSLVTKKVRTAIKNKPQNVVFPGYIAGDIIEGAYSSADLFFFASYEETEGIVVLEALAAKCPVLIRDIPVYEEWMENGINCYKGKNNDDFSRLLEGIVEGKIPSTVDNGYLTAKERSIENIGLRLQSIYEKILK